MGRGQGGGDEGRVALLVRFIVADLTSRVRLLVGEGGKGGGGGLGQGAGLEAQLHGWIASLWAELIGDASLDKVGSLDKAPP